MDCYTPYPVEEAAEAIGFHHNKVPLLTLIGGLMGVAAMFGLETWVSVGAYPPNIAGRPPHSWPALIFATSIPLLALIGGLMGVPAMFGLETWVSVWAYPLNIAGRPTYSWPAFIVPAYEWTILFAGLSAAFGMLALNGLPALYHPLFNAPNFRDGATSDKFFLCLEALDPKFDLIEGRA